MNRCWQRPIYPNYRGRKHCSGRGIQYAVGYVGIPQLVVVFSILAIGILDEYDARDWNS